MLSLEGFLTRVNFGSVGRVICSNPIYTLVTIDTNRDALSRSSFGQFVSKVDGRYETSFLLVHGRRASEPPLQPLIAHDYYQVPTIGGGAQIDGYLLPPCRGHISTIARDAFVMGARQQLMQVPIPGSLVHSAIGEVAEYLRHVSNFGRVERSVSSNLSSWYLFQIGRRFVVQPIQPLLERTNYSVSVCFVINMLLFASAVAKEMIFLENNHPWRDDVSLCDYPYVIFYLCMDHLVSLEDELQGLIDRVGGIDWPQSKAEFVHLLWCGCYDRNRRQLEDADEWAPYAAMFDRARLELGVSLA